MHSKFILIWNEVIYYKCDKKKQNFRNIKKTLHKSTPQDFPTTELSRWPTTCSPNWTQRSKANRRAKEVSEKARAPDCEHGGGMACRESAVPRRNTWSKHQGNITVKEVASCRTTAFDYGVLLKARAPWTILVGRAPWVSSSFNFAHALTSRRTCWLDWSIGACFSSLLWFWTLKFFLCNSAFILIFFGV